MFQKLCFLLDRAIGTVDGNVVQMAGSVYPKIERYRFEGDHSGANREMEYDHFAPLDHRS